MYTGMWPVCPGSPDLEYVLHSTNYHNNIIYKNMSYLVVPLNVGYLIYKEKQQFTELKSPCFWKKGEKLIIIWMSSNYKLGTAAIFSRNGQ